ncbi:hypothetical protein [Mariniphaga sediminis]|uniref:hypothetical protein n=1 Tax=Mariniphaga sediminis TaxID=1628158 RepID=UPI0035618D58
MKEQLLALLVAKFAGVPKATLERIAEKKAGSVTDEAQLQSIADGIDYGQIVQSEVDSKITDANKKAIQNYETTHKLKDGKPVSTEPVEPGNQKPDDISAIVANAVKSAVEPLQQKIESFEKKDTQNTYLGKVKSTLSEKKIPESFWGKRTIDVESDEQLSAVVSEIETDWTNFRQEQINEGVMIDKPASSGGSPSDGESLAKQIEAGTKEIVEQQKN